MDAQRALLDELMGSARNLTEEERRGHKEISWDDKEVCGFYMVKFCPHDLFVNTRSDLGECCVSLLVVLLYLSRLVVSW
ncbi:hypothetical protein M8C21_009969 [Ambrosia artemisiifolia]|uniref:Luc7-like protein 3 n=1 Tax=Ambrosia artemisiifolia TaxID=4212 RepID=A0AAD5DA17_AMBAR|nr:hypothetical protein M8C21_009969 [Ambrosia artemisiifolia]